MSRILPPLVEEFFEAGATAAVPGASPPELHRFRLSSKRFRYTLELFDQFYGSEMERAAKAMKSVQDRLGAINDRAATIDLLAGDRRAVAAIRKLLGPRIFEFRRYWKASSLPASWPGGSAGSVGRARFVNPGVRRRKPQTSFSFSFFMR